MDSVCSSWIDRYDRKTFSVARSIKTESALRLVSIIPIFSNGVRSLRLAIG